MYRDSPLADRQLHAVLFAQDEDRVDVYGHYEYNWIRHPIKHARQEDIRHRGGSRRMKAHLQAVDPRTDYEHVVLRKPSHLPELIDQRPPCLTLPE